MTMFCDTALAARIERAEAELIAAWNGATRSRLKEAAGFAIPIGGGVASYAEPDSPINKVAGLGFAGTPDLAGVEDAYAERGAPIQAEVASLADRGVLDLLADRGYRLVSFENVLGRPLGDAVEPVAPPGVEVRPSGDDEFDDWTRVVVDASLHPDEEGAPAHEEFPREILENAERDTVGLVRRYLARLDGVPAGGGSIRVTDRIAQFTGAATAPPFRRRGVQNALLAARLADATAAGCEIAVITVQPGSTSQHNAQRRGFALLYTRAILVKEPGVPSR
jgi:GNAT superfamily N-acetyltransferase